MGDPFQEQLGAEIRQAFAAKDWPGALTIVDLWCRLYPKHAQGWYWRAGCLMYVGNLDRALEDAERALDLDPAYQNARTLRDSLLLKIAEARRALEDQPASEHGPEPIRVRARITSALRIPSAPHLRLELNREILNVARAIPRISLNPSNQICGTSGRAKPEVISARTLNQPVVEPEPEPVTQVETRREPERDVEPESEDESELEIVIVPEPEPEPEPELEPAPEPEPETNQKTEEESDYQCVQESETETSSFSDPEIVSFEVDEPLPNGVTSEKAVVTVATRSSSARKPNILSSKGQLRNLPWRAIAALFVVVIAISWAVFDQMRVPGLRVNSSEASEIRKRIYASVVPPHSSVASETTCDQSRLTEYVSVFGNFQPDPTAWESAKYCLEVLGTEESVVELLNFLRPGHRRWGSSALFQRTSRRGTASDVRSVLIRMDDDVSKPLVTALGDECTDVRKIAAEALAYRRNAGDVRALVRNCRSGSREVREVVASVLGDLVGSGQLEGPEGFELMRWMAGDESTAVRFEVAKALIVFEGSEAKALAESMAGDPNRRVSETARKVVIAFSRRK